MIFGGTSARAPILLEQPQNSTGFNTEEENTCPSASHIGSPTLTFRDMYLHLTV